MAQIYPTFKCNLSCKHCLYDCKFNSKSIPFEKLKIIIEKLKKLHVVAIVVNGGEPLLYPKFNDLVTLINNKNFGWELLTNGTLITSDKAKVISENEPYKVSISLHGGDAETHNWLTNGGFKEAVRGITTLRKYYDGEILIQSLTHPKRNKKEFLKLVKFCEENNLKLNAGSKIMPIGRAWKNWNLFKDKDISFDFDSMIPDNIRFNPYTKNNFSVVVASILNTFKEHGCGAGSFEIYIDPEGYTYGCCNFMSANTPRKRGGNIVYEDPIKLWRYDPFLNETRSLHPLGCFYKEECPLWKENKCPHCYGISLQLFNSYVYPHPDCFDYIKNNIDSEFTPIKYSGDDNE